MRLLLRLPRLLLFGALGLSGLLFSLLGEWCIRGAAWVEDIDISDMYPVDDEWF